MATTHSTHTTLEALEDKLKDLETKAKAKGTQTEIAAVSGLKTAKDNISRKLQELKTTHASNVARAKADIDTEVAVFKASIDELSAKLKTDIRK
jgi:hypothetical protein